MQILTAPLDGEVEGREDRMNATNYLIRLTSGHASQRQFRYGWPVDADAGVSQWNLSGIRRP